MVRKTKQPPASSVQRIAEMTFAYIFPFLLAKVEKKGRTKQELQEVITWLTGYDSKQQESFLENEMTYGDFINKARINPHANQIKGAVCGYRVEDIEDPFMRKVKCLDKLIDELAKGKKMEKILRRD